MTRRLASANDLRVEARQLRLLWRHSVRRLLNDVAASRDADASAFVVWAGTLALTLPLLFSMRRVMMYQFAARLPAAEIDAMIRRDHLFFIVYSMLAAALLAVIVWDAMFPDRTDQEIIGVLPVRPRTSALARLAGAVTVCLGSAAAIAIPPAVFDSLAMTTFTGFLRFPRLFIGQVLATTGIAAFVFFVLMTARGLIALVAGQRGADRLALLLQAAAIVSIVEGLVFLPGMLARAEGADGDTLRAVLPPLWFYATYGWIAGTGAVPWREALFGPAVTVGVFLVLSAISIASADWMGRRALLATGRTGASRLTAVVTAVSLVVARSGPVRAMFRFAIRSIVTSRRHLLLMSTRFGMATALSLVGLMMIHTSEGLVFNRPRGYWLAPPLILIYVTLIGLRSCLAIAADIEANWVFRLIEPSVGAVRRASRLVLLVAGVAPVVLVFATLSLSAWPAISALRTIALVAVSGIAIAELVLWGWTHVPFATAHPPNPNAIKSGWPRHVGATIAVGLLLPAAFVALSRSTRGTLLYTTIVALVTLTVRWRNERELRLSPASFEAGEPEALTLQLSEAGH